MLGPEYNEISKWEEKEVVEGLTLYDIYREPRKQVPVYFPSFTLYSGPHGTEYYISDFRR